METTESESHETHDPIVALGQWFSPFAGYESKPYSPHNKNCRTKNFRFKIKDVGGVRMHLTWDRTFPLQVEDERELPKKGVLVLPYANQEIDMHELRVWEERLETSLLFLYGKTDKLSYKYREFAHALELESLTGEIFRNDFVEDTVSTFAVPTSTWRNVGGGDENLTLLIPETQNTLQNINLRIA